MSKFLTIVEGNLPEQDIDKLTSAKRELQRLFNTKGIKCSAKTFKDIICINVGGKVVELEIKNVRETASEDAEDRTSVDAVTAIANMPDQKPGRPLGNSSRKLYKARDTIANAAVKVADRFNKAANT